MIERVSVPGVPPGRRFEGAVTPVRPLLADLAGLVQQSGAREIWLGIALGTGLAWSAFLTALLL